ncbi:phage tail tape measure protein [Pseudomonas sp. GD03875]|uniref:phage tail tape measure protein n=1 Tax=Pseudomonas sp. GD03875 TaxID=2975398 RepID=UPI00244778DC|nr:phage tail tape measure protein [Pseudomonas sp. GD03875]MDH0894353.1 phage tail tape measure protein [Pseudomonas sp. GD03875]
MVSGTLHSAFGSARSTVQQLGRATEGLTRQQKELASSIQRGLGTLAPSSLAALNRDYERVGRTIDTLRLKQEKLTASIARGQVLKERRAELRGEMMETVGTAAALGAPLVLAGRTAMEFRDRTNDIAITGGWSAAEEEQLGATLRTQALKWNQTQMEMAAGTQVLIAGGISSLTELEAYAPVMAKTATATRASMDDLGSVAIALNDNLKIGASGLERSMNMLAFAGKSGQFELADMARWLPQLTPQFAALGVTGERAVAEIGASLQIARRGAGTNDEAANNFKNFLSKLTAKDTLKAFEGAGIDLQASMKGLVEDGLTPVQAMLETVTKYVGSKGPAAAAEFQAAMELKDDAERQSALDRLNEAYKLGELFADQQVLSFLRPALANRADLAAIQRGSLDAADKGVLDDDLARRMQSPKEQVKALTNNLSELGIAVGSVLLPPMIELTQAAIPVVQTFATWAAENPGLVKGIVGVVGGLLVGKMAFLGMAYGVNLAISPIVAMTTTITSLSAKWTMLQALWHAGKFAPLVTGLGKGVAGLRWMGGALVTTGRYGALFLRGTLMAFVAPLAQMGKGALFLGKVLGGSLLNGIRLAGHAVLWLGRALLLNPIGLAITAIALGAYLIYRNWSPIKTFFVGLWSEIKAGFNGGLSGILELIINFSPLGLFHRAMAGVLGYFGVELPGKFTEFGRLMVTGLVTGITGMAGALKDSVVGMGESVKGWFAERLDIHSPSRVFVDYGANIAQGAAIGISGQTALVRNAALGMAMATAVPLAPPDMSNVSRAAMQGGGIAAPMTIHYSPTINVQGGEDVQAAVERGLRISEREFARMMDDYQRNQARRSYGDHA